MPGRILVAAGTNGAGKSSIVQPAIQLQGGVYFNPDEMTRQYMSAGMKEDEANGLAWTTNYQQLKLAIDKDQNYAFETTLGGHSIAFELMRSLAMERRLTILFVGLGSVDLHIQRVVERVRRGGHAIRDDMIRKRYDRSRENLLSFFGTRARIELWDNSESTVDGRPSPRKQFVVDDRVLTLPPGHDPANVPTWVKPLLARALQFAVAAA